MLRIIRGWLLLYLIGTAPILAFWSAGLSGWYLDYPIWLFILIFIVLLVPLLLLILKIPSAPSWNIAVLWVGTSLISFRTLSAVILMDRPLEDFELSIIAAIISFSVVWAVIWTWYFLVSKQVAEIYIKGHDK